MKNLRKVLTIMLFILVFSSVVFASEEYILKREMLFKNETGRELRTGSVEIYIGQKNFTEYHKDGDILITPAPDELREDEYGNLYAYYDVTGYKPGRTLKVTIERAFETGTFEKEISVRSEATVNSENQIYVEEQVNVDSENAKIIAKAKELTEGVSSDYKRALAIFEYVNTEMEYTTASNYANKGSVSALENEKGVCEEFATLFGALCRAVDIPCKLVVGNIYEKNVVKESEIVFDDTIGEHVLTEPEYEYELTNHVWNEIYLDDYGWLPVDTCVLYAPQGERVAYTGAFCMIEDAKYIASGIYNAARVNRDMINLTEKSYVEELYPASSVQKEEHSFSDIGNYTWAEDSINTLYKMDIIKGYTDSEYGPAGNVSRIEFISLLSRVLKYLNYQVERNNDEMVYYFMDYDKRHYSKSDYDYLMRCLEEEIPYDKFAVGYYAMTNIFGSSLDINKPITRGEVVALMDAFLRYEADVTAEFNDVAGYKFEESILKAYSNGLITGYGDGSFKPNGTITRAEIAVILDRYIGVKDCVL